MNRNFKTGCLLIVMCLPAFVSFSQDVTVLVQRVRAKLNLVNDYMAVGKMKTDVAFIKAPVGNVKIFYKKPDKFKVKRDHGISILPKGGFSINIASVISGKDYMILSAGETMTDGVKTKVVKLLPASDNSEVVLATLYIDAANLLVKKATVTTRESGTYEMKFTYGRYAAYGLPDKVIFGFNAKEYKMPKGVTLEFDDDGKPTAADRLRGKKGKVEISYSSYIINQGVSDGVFK